MANKRVTELTAIDGDDVANDDLLMIVDVSDSTMAATGTNKKITVAEFATDSTLGGAFVAKSTLTTDGDMLTRASGVPDRITRADLAQDSAFSSRYQSVTNDSIFFPAFAMSAVTTGTGRVGTGTYAPAQLFDQTSPEICSFATNLPLYWASYDVYLFWTNAGAGSGDVRWDFARGSAADGATIGVGTVHGTGNYTAPAQNLLKITHMTSGGAITKSTSSQTLQTFYVQRQAGDAGDTLGNDCALLGVLFVRAS